MLILSMISNIFKKCCLHTLEKLVSVGSKLVVLAVDGFCYSSSFSHNCYVHLHKS